MTRRFEDKLYKSVSYRKMPGRFVSQHQTGDPGQTDYSMIFLITKKNLAVRARVTNVDASATIQTDRHARNPGRQAETGPQPQKKTAATGRCFSEEKRVAV